MDVDRFLRDIAGASNISDVRNGHSLADTLQLLQTTILQKNDLVLCIGAGDITNLATALIIPNPNA